MVGSDWVFFVLNELWLEVIVLLVNIAYPEIEGTFLINIHHI
jgi:hypothetical protein